MSQTSPRLELPYIQPAQAQKHVTHNEALQTLDSVVQLALLDLDAIDPPVDPAPGDVYALGAVPSGAWDGQGGQLAAWSNEAWHFFVPLDGWRAWNLGTDRAYVFQQGTWHAEIADLDNLDRIGVGANADAINRLVVSSDATLLTHDANGGHQLKLNKAAQGDTASVVFQTGYDGRAEIGLAGDDALSVKTRAPGGNWAEMLRLDPVAQSVTMATGGGVEARLTQTGLSLDGGIGGWQQVYDQSNVTGVVSQTGGDVTGALFETGNNANGRYVKFADGTMICTIKGFTLNYLNTSSILGDWTFPHAFSSVDRAVSFTFLRGTEGTPNRNYRYGVHVDDAGGSSALSKARLILFSNEEFTDSGKMTVCAIAVGRWF